MAQFGASNQLLQIDTGKARTQIFNASQSPIALYAGIGETQILGQRYFGVTSTSLSNPAGAPAVLMLVQYLATSATTTGNLQAGPAPVYWTDSTFTTVSGISTESAFGLNGIAGYMLVNTTDLPSLTAAQILGGQLLIQVAGYLMGAFAPASGTAGIGNAVVGAAGTFASASVVAGTAPGYRTLGYQASAVASGLCNMIVTADII